MVQARWCQSALWQSRLGLFYKSFFAAVDRALRTRTRSPDLSTMKFFFLGALLDMVYETPIHCDTDLVTRISLAAVNIREARGIFERVRQPM